MRMDLVASTVSLLVLLTVFVRCEKIQECTSDTGVPGSCIPLTNCPEIDKLTKIKTAYVSDHNKLKALMGACGCNLNSTNVLVCCEFSLQVTERPPPKGLPSTSTSRSAPTMSTNHGPYSIITNTRSTVKPPMPNASPSTTTTVSPTMRPWMSPTCSKQPPIFHVMTNVEDREHVHTWAVFLEITVKSYRCVGTMITDRFVLTAAHCLHSLKLDDITMYFGLFKRSELASCLHEDTCREKKAAQFIIHEEYHPHQKLNDVALILTEDAVQTSEFISPICLPVNHTFDESKNNSVISFGWGTTIGEVLSDTKRVAFLRVIPQDECANSLRFNTTALSSMMCTRGFPPGVDVCQGDSGAPLVQVYQHLMYVVGVVSYGPRCGMITDVPGKAMRVSYFMNWILFQINRREV